jgi:hypothetical protein
MHECRPTIDVKLLLAAPPKLHGPESAPTDGWRLNDAALLFLESHVRNDMRTIETGAGLSTIVFALKRANIRASCPIVS